jgi:hypothetical protein
MLCFRSSKVANPKKEIIENYCPFIVFHNHRARDEWSMA